MKSRFYFTLAMAATLCFAAMISAAGARPDAHEQNAFTPKSVPWGPLPPSLAPGAQLAVLEGNPAGSSGDYTVRLKMPDGYRIAPHWHPQRENVTVISGTFKVGMGDTFDTNKMTAFPAGSFAFLDPQMHHYAMATGEVVVQVHGTAPFQINYVNPADDPGKK
jgi:anti-sigma factor ChrR (cupin superfamily)